MSFLGGFDTTRGQSALDLASLTPEQQPPDKSVFGGLGWNGRYGLLPSWMRQGFLSAADDVFQLGFDATGGALDRMSGTTAGKARSAVDSVESIWRSWVRDVRESDMAPSEFGYAATALSGFARVIPEAMSGGLTAAGVVGGLQGAAATREAINQGVDKQTAIAKGTLEGVFAGAGTVLPMHAKGLGLAKNMGLGAGANAAFGAVSRASTKGLLEVTGYKEMADQVHVFDTAGMLTDLTLGAGFGAIGHLSQKAEVPQLQQRAEARDAAMAVNDRAVRDLRAPGATVDSPASIPANEAARTAHVNNFERAREMEAAGELDRFAPEPFPQEAEFVQREPSPDLVENYTQLLNEISRESLDAPPSIQSSQALTENFSEKIQNAKPPKQKSKYTDSGLELMRFEDHPVISYLLGDVGGIMSKSAAKEKWGQEKFNSNSGLWDDAARFSNPTHNKIYKRNGGATPDEATQALIDAGFLKPDAQVSDLWNLLEKTSKEVVSLNKQLRSEASRVSTSQKQAISFDRAASKIEPGEKPVNVSELQIGDTIEIAGETLKVTDIDPDSYAVTLEDGAKFGVQHVEQGRVLYTKEHTHTPEDLSNVFLPDSFVSPLDFVERPDQTQAMAMALAKQEGLPADQAHLLYSKDATKPAEPHTTETAKAELHAMPEGRALEDSGLVTIVEKPSDLPPRPDGMAHPEDAQGMFSKDRVYLVASNIDKGSVRQVILHEVGVHFGMEKMLGEDLHAHVLDYVMKRASAGEGPFARAVEVARKAETPEEHLGREALAYLVEHHPELGIVQRVLSAIKTFLFKTFGGKFIDLSAADLRYMAEASLRMAAEKASEPPKDSIAAHFAEQTKEAQRESDSLYSLKSKADEVRDFLAKGGSAANAIRLVAQAAERKLTANEASGLKERLLKAAEYVDPSILSPEARLEKAAEMVAGNLEQEAVERVQRAMRNQQRAISTMADFSKMVRGGVPIFGKGGALARLLVEHRDSKANVQSLEATIAAARNNAMRHLTELFHGSGKFFGLFEDRAFTSDLIREIFEPGSTQNAKAKEGASTWKSVTDSLLAQMQQAGRPIRELVGWAIPMSHDSQLVAKAGRDVWVSEAFPLLERDRYRNPDGSRMTDNQLAGALNEAFDAISSDGLIGKEAAGLKLGMPDIAARRAKYSRFLHFKDGDAWLKYHAKYGERSVWDTMLGHVDYTAKQIALMEKFGPDAKSNFRMLVDRATDLAARRSPQDAAKIQEQADRALRLMDYLAGDLANPSAKNAVNRWFSGFRNVLTSAQLGGSVITALSDEVMLRQSAALHRISQVELTRIEGLLALSSDARADAHRLGAALQDIAGETARFAQDRLGPCWSSKMANATLKISGLHWLDGIRRAAISMGLMSKLGELSKAHETLSDLHPEDNRLMLNKGLTPENWSLMRKADLEPWHGAQVLSPEAILRIPDSALAAEAQARIAVIDQQAADKIESIKGAAFLAPEHQARLIERIEAAGENEKRSVFDSMRNDAVRKLLGITSMEENTVVPVPGAAQGFAINEALRKGTVLGELAKSMLQFKGFAFSHWNTFTERLSGLQTVGSKFAYAASSIVGLTVMGAVSQMLSDLAKGKNPRNYLDPSKEHWGKNVMGAFVHGGAMGIYGDLLFADETRFGHSPAGALLGPIVGAYDNAYNLTIGAAHRMAKGEDPHVGANAIRFAKNFLPGQNLWYSRLLLDRYIFQQAQELASPGYLQRVKDTARREYGQTFWAVPGGDLTAPNLATAAGE